MRHFIAASALLTFCALAGRSQGNYEVQVYGSELTPKGVTVVELHSNVTVKGVKDTVDGVLPTNHAVHETVEITHGFGEWLEVGFYQFTSIQPDGGLKWVGTHLRPRVSVPARYGLPVGLSLSAECGYQRASFSSDTWGCEFRPIIDKESGKWYFAFNPTLERAFHGPGVASGVEFSPNVKFSYAALKKAQLGLEYYGAYGPVTGFNSARDQEHAFVPAIDVDFGPKWEFNFGVGVGVTQATDHLLVKAILGYRLGLHDSP